MFLLICYTITYVSGLFHVPVNKSRLFIDMAMLACKKTILVLIVVPEV